MTRTITHRGLLAMSLAGLVLSWALPGKADAAITLGQVSPAVNPPACMVPGSYLQADAATAPYEVPSPGGVITSWSHRGRSGGGGSGRLQIWREAPGLFNFRLVGTTEVREFNAAGLVDSFPTRDTVSTGERLGLRAVETDTGCIYGGMAGDTVYVRPGGEPSFGDVSSFGVVGSDALVNVSAVLEPDADGDGFGDETQDGCPTDASAQGSCPPPNDGTTPPGDGTTPPDDGPTPPVNGVLPSNEFSFGKVKRNKKRGTARLPVEVLAPGEVVLAKTKKVKKDVEQVEAITAGAAQDAIVVKLKVKAKGKAKKRLNRKGKAKVKAKVTYTPDGGEPNTRKKKLKLKKR